MASEVRSTERQSMNADTARIQEIRERLNAATPLEWPLDDAYHYRPSGYHLLDYAVSWNGSSRFVERIPLSFAEDIVRVLKFSITSRSDIPWLLAKLAASEARETRLREALKDLFALMDEGWLGRDTRFDHEPGWGLRQMPYVERLKNAHDALAEPPPPNPGNGDTSGGVEKKGSCT